MRKRGKGCVGKATTGNSSPYVNQWQLYNNNGSQVKKKKREGVENLN